jgi:hypothetical protein
VLEEVRLLRLNLFWHPWRLECARESKEGARHGIISFYLAPTLSLVVLAAVLVGKRRRVETNPSEHHCESCRTPISMRRISIF